MTALQAVTPGLLAKDGTNHGTLLGGTASTVSPLLPKNSPSPNPLLMN